MQEIFTHSIPAFILVLGVIIFVHESGHLLVAKAFGMRVFIFSFGFGKRLFGFQWGDTDCRVSLIPLGGYVKLEGEPEDHLSEDTSAAVVGDGRDFLSRPRWQRLLVYLAGPAMNVALTVAGFTTLFMLGWRPEPTLQEPAVIGVVEPDSPAALAGLRPGDEITAVDGQPQANWGQAQVAILLRPDREITLSLRHDGTTRDVTLHTRVEGAQKAGSIGVTPLVVVGDVVPDQPAARAGLHSGDGIVAIDGSPVRSFDDVVKAVRGAQGPALALQIYRAGSFQELTVTPNEGRIGVASTGGGRPLSFLPAVGHGLEQTWQATKQTGGMLRDLVTARISPRAGLAGPIGIAKLSGEAARAGLPAVVYVITMISLSVGLLNLFPLAPLDGGHMAILVGEGIFRRDFSVTVKTWVMNAGAAVIFLLIGLVLYSDLSKILKFLP